MSVQTTGYTSAPAKAYPGLLVSDGGQPPDIGSVAVDASTAVPPGVLIMRTANGDYAGDVPPAVAADDDAIMVAVATSASQQILGTGGTAFDGVVAAGRISPPSKLTIIRSSHADHDAVAHVLVGLDENGITVTETLTGANGGGDTLTTTNFYSRLTSVTIAAQAGVGGTTKVGILGPASRTLEGADVLGVSLREHHARTSPSETDNQLWDDGVEMPVLRHGRLYVLMENAFRAGECPLVRVVASGAEQRGAFRGIGDTDSGDAIPFRRGRTLNSGSAGEYAVLAMRLI